MESSLIKSHFNILAEPHFGRAKKIRVWINGDTSHKCFEVTLNPNFLRTWNTVLQYLTNTIDPPFGVIRKLICLSSKKAVTCFEELKTSEKYIALGINSKLIIMKQGYKSPSEQELLKAKKTMRKKFYSGDMNSINFQFLQDTKRRNLTVIYIVANGQACQSPTKVVLNESDLAHWSVMLEFISKMLDIPEGIQHICSIFGDIVMDPFELQHGFLYVALPFNEKFEKIDYTSTFGGATNKSSYVLKIRKNNGPSTVCCPIKEKSKNHQKAKCSRIKCQTKSDDVRECRLLLPEEIPESCRTRTTEIEDEKREGINTMKDCCLANNKRNLWCKLKRYKPGCCEIHKLSSLSPDQQNKLDTCDDLNESDPPEDPKHTQKKLSIDSIEESFIDIGPDTPVQATALQNDDKIVTYFMRDDNVPTKDKNHSISTNVLRGTQTVADSPETHMHHVKISSLCLPEIHQEVEYLEKSTSTVDNLNSVLKKVEGDPARIDKSSNTERSLVNEERSDISGNISKYSQCTGYHKHDQRFENKVGRGISAIFSEVNVYPDHQPKKMTPIYIKNRTDINVGYAKHGKRYRRDDENKSCESPSLSGSSLTTPVVGNVGLDHICCFCREPRKPNVSTKQVPELKSNGVEEQINSTQVFIEDRNEHENDKTPTNIVPRKQSDGVKKERSKGSQISEEELKITIDNNEKTHKDNDDISTNPDSGRPQSLEKIPEDNIPSLDSDEAQQSRTRRKSSLRNSAASAAQKIMKIIEDNMVFADLEQAEMTEKIVPSEQNQENSSERKSMRRGSARDYQNVAPTLGQNDSQSIPEERQEISPMKQSSRRSSGSRKGQKEKNTLHPESQSKLARQSVSEEKCVKSYSDAIMDVKKILKGSTAIQISEVLSKVKNDSDKKKTANLHHTPVAKTQQDLSNSTDSSGEENNGV